MKRRPTPPSAHVARSRRILAVVVALAVTQLGGLCEGSSSGDPDAAVSALIAEPGAIDVQASDLFMVEFRVDTNGDVQAVDLDLSWDPALVSHVSLSPHAEFDDDGQFFGPIFVDAAGGSIAGVRDSRHGPTAIEVTAGVATAWFRAEAPGQSEIVVTGRVADSAGLRSAALTATASVTATP